MRYAILIYANEEVLAQLPESEQMRLMGAWARFMAEIVEAGVRVGGEALQPTMLATTVRQEQGQALTIDGPFAETKEHLGGFFLVEVPNLDEALAWAARMPHLAHGGSAEVRPIVTYEPPAG